MANIERRIRVSRMFGFYLIVLFFPLLLNEFLPLDSTAGLRIGVYFLALGFELVVIGFFLTPILRWQGYGTESRQTPRERMALLGGGSVCLLAGAVLLFISQAGAL